MSYTVNKIGGANMSELEEVRELVGSHIMKNQENSALVVSAFSGVTNALIAAMDHITEKGNLDDITLDRAFEKVESLIAEQVEKNPNFEIEEKIKKTIAEKIVEAKAVLKEFGDSNLRVRPETNLIRDKIIRLGEVTAALVLKSHLQAYDIPAEFVSDVSAIMESENPDLHEGIQAGIEKRLKDIEDLKTETRKKILIFGGHIDGLPNGIVQDIGRSYSDTTAVDALVALGKTGIDIERVVYWKDVDGMLTASPEYLNGGSTPKRVPDISLSEALEVARAGSSLLHVQALELAFKYKVNLVLKNISKPDDEGTTYGINEVSTGEPFKTISSHAHDCLTLDITNVAGQAGVIQYFSRIFQEHNISINDAITEGNSISFTIPLPRDKADKENLRNRIRKIQKNLGSIKINGNTEKIDCEWSQDSFGNISVVGIELANSPGILATITSVLAAYGINIVMVGHTTKQKRISFYVRRNDREKGVRVLHKFFFDKDEKVQSYVKEQILNILNRY